MIKMRHCSTVPVPGTVHINASYRNVPYCTVLFKIIFRMYVRMYFYYLFLKKAILLVLYLLSSYVNAPPSRVQ